MNAMNYPEMDLPVKLSRVKPGGSLAAYQIYEKIGNGGFGKVFRAVHVQGKQYALKQMPIPRSSIEKEKILRELDLTLMMSHTKHGINVHDLFQEKGMVYLVLDYFPHGMIRIADLTEAEVRHIISNALHYLGECHARTIVHRDVKPHNFLQGKKEIIGIDLGVSYQLDTETPKLTSVTGTPLYMAPEVMEGKPYDMASDMWSIGIVTYQLLTQKHPFVKPKDTIYPDLLKQEYRKPPILQYGPHVEDFLNKLLCYDPKQRMTAWECLDHPWLTQDSPIRTLTWTQYGKVLEYVYDQPA